jgi:hypothetical protein
MDRMSKCCRDAGGRAPKVGALGDAGSHCRGRCKSDRTHQPRDAVSRYEKLEPKEQEKRICHQIMNDYRRQLPD